MKKAAIKVNADLIETACATVGAHFPSTMLALFESGIVAWDGKQLVVGPLGLALLKYVK